MYLGCKELVSRGDVVEMGDTLVLETSAFARESSNLSIPTKDLWRRGRVVYGTALLTRSALKGTIRSNRIVSASLFRR